MNGLKSLTERQAAVYNFIVEKIQNRGYGPTVREIAEEFGIRSPNGVMCHLKALEKKGAIRRSPHKSRAIELVHDSVQRERGLVLAGRVAAGVLHEAVEQNERIDLGDMFHGPNLFALEVSGDSMIEAQIADGDYVVVREQPTARIGEMVVAETDDGDATLKYWYPEKNRIRLQPANSSMRPIYVQNARIRGVIVGVVRKIG